MEELRKVFWTEQYNTEVRKEKFDYNIQKDEASDQAFVLYKVQNIIVLVAVILLIISDMTNIHFAGFDAATVISEIYSPFTAQELINELSQLIKNVITSK